MSTDSEFERFDKIVGKVFAVRRDEIVRREKEYQRKRKRVREKRESEKRITDAKK
jgi:hypothetical protein